RRRLRPGVVHDLGQRAHFEFPIGAFDANDLARAFCPRNEFAQVLMRPIVGVESLRGLGFLQHGVPFRKLSFAMFCHASLRLSWPARCWWTAPFRPKPVRSGMKRPQLACERTRDVAIL